MVTQGINIIVVVVVSLLPLYLERESTVTEHIQTEVIEQTATITLVSESVSESYYYRLMTEKGDH